MNAREFFWLVANMREAQKNYFKTRDQKTLRACKYLEGQVDEAIYQAKLRLKEREVQMSNQ